MIKSRLTNTGMALTFACLLPISVSAESLKDIYQQAVENDHQYLAAKAALNAGKEVTKQGLARLLPDIRAGASYSNNDYKTAVVIRDPATGQPVQDPETGQNQTEVESVSDWSFNRQITLTQPIFNMQAWYGYKQVKTIKDKAVVNFVGEQQSLILRVAKAYFDALKAVDTLATRKAEEKALAHQLEQTKQRFDVGLTAITEVHEAQAAFDSATASRLLAEGSVGISFEAIEVLTGEPAQTLTPLKDNFVANGPEPSARIEWEQLALENNVQLKLANIDEKTKKYNYKVKRAGHMPTLSGSLSASDRDRGGDNVGFDIPGERITASVNLSIPLYSGGSVSSESRQAKNEYYESSEIRKKTQRDVLQRARSQHLTVVTSVSTIKARKQAIVSSKSALEATQAGYDVGTRDLVDVLNAQRNLYSAEKDYLDTLYNYILAALELKEIGGQLTPSDIENLNNWLDSSRRVSSRP